MGLFTWLKKTGAKANTRSSAADNANKAAPANNAENAAFEARAAQQKKIMLNGLVDSLNLEVDNLDLDYAQGQVTVYGQVSSDHDKSMIVSALRNADGVSNVDSRLSVTAPAMQMYTVKKGDSLSKIAKAYYGNPMKYKEIFNANTDILSDPNKIFPGQELQIPNL